MSSISSLPQIISLSPLRAVEGGRVTIRTVGLPLTADSRPAVRIGDTWVPASFASTREVKFVIPTGLPGGRMPVRLEEAPGGTLFLDVGKTVATGLHQVDSPAFDREGNLYVTYSGSRGQQAGVSVYRVRRDGSREVFITTITNPTSLAFDPQGRLHVSSRYDGTVTRIEADGGREVVATELGVACGITFAPDGTMFIGDRSGTVFRLGLSGRVTPFVSLPPSVAAFHLAVGADGTLYATAPTLATRDVIYRIDRQGQIDTHAEGFGRPQGLAVDANGDLYVAEAMAGSSGIYRIRRDAPPELLVSGPAIIGLAFDPLGGFVVATADTAYRFDS